MTLYLFSAGAYFIFMLFSKFSDQECSKTHFISWLVIIFASALWIVAIPISLIEIRSKALAKVRVKTTKQLAISQGVFSVEASHSLSRRIRRKL
jgi:hypothetical protein